MPENHKPRRGKTATVLTDAHIETLADEAQAGYPSDRLRPRSGRPLLGSAPADVVPVRLDPELRAAVQERAEADHTTVSEVMRAALREHLNVG